MWMHLYFLRKQQPPSSPLPSGLQQQQQQWQPVVDDCDNGGHLTNSY